VTSAVTLEQLLGGISGLEQDSDLLSSGINNRLFKTRTQREGNIDIYGYALFIFDQG
jgi:hypothetical protein